MYICQRNETAEDIMIGLQPARCIISLNWVTGSAGTSQSNCSRTRFSYRSSLICDWFKKNRAVTLCYLFNNKNLLIMSGSQFRISIIATWHQYVGVLIGRYEDVSLGLFCYCYFSTSVYSSSKSILILFLM